MPKDFSPEVRDFILRLLTKEPHRRLGAGGAEEVATYSNEQCCKFTDGPQVK